MDRRRFIAVCGQICGTFFVGVTIVVVIAVAGCADFLLFLVCKGRLNGVSACAEERYCQNFAQQYSVQFRFHRLYSIALKLCCGNVLFGV